MIDSCSSRYLNCNLFDIQQLLSLARKGIHWYMLQVLQEAIIDVQEMLRVLLIKILPVVGVAIMIITANKIGRCC